MTPMQVFYSTFVLIVLFGLLVAFLLVNAADGAVLPILEAA